MKTLPFVLLSLLFSAQVFASPIPPPRTQRVSGEVAQSIFDNLTTVRKNSDSRLWFRIDSYGRTHTEAEAVPAKDCSGAVIKSGMYRPSLFSMFNQAVCRTEGGQAVCELSISEDRVRESKKPSDPEDGDSKIVSCSNLKSDFCIAGNGKSLEEACAVSEEE